MQEKRQTAMKTGFDFVFACDENVHFWLTKDIYQEMLTTPFSRVIVSSVCNYLYVTITVLHIFRKKG